MDSGTGNSPRQMDSRIKKTQKALFDALMAMLARRNFNDITVNNLCSEAMLSRSTFYAHFDDKYDLLRQFLDETRRNIIRDVNKYDILESEINGFIAENKRAISNLIKDANGETLMLISEFMSSIVSLTIKRQATDASSAHHIILSNFFIGGLVNILTWMVENNFPPEITMMNKYLYSMLEHMTTWDAEQERKESSAPDIK